MRGMDNGNPQPGRDVVVLVYAPRRRALNAKATGLYAHLGIRALESYLACNAPDVKVVCLDGEILTEDEIRREMAAELEDAKFPLVGFSTILGNYSVSLDLALYAKSLNPDVLIVAGGPWATELPLQVLTTAEHIDLVVRGDGEEALLRLVRGADSEHLAGVVSRNSVTVPERTFVPLEQLPWPLARTSTLAPYFENFRRVYPAQSFRTAPIYFKKFGCDQRCPYCAIPKAPMRPRTATEAWHEVMDVSQRLGANHFWDISDNAELGFWEEFGKLSSTFNNHDELSFFTFISAERVTPEFINAFRRAGGVKLFIGFDSHHPRVLRQVKAGRATVEDNLRAIRLIREARLFLDASFIVGLPTETQETFRSTHRFIEDEIAPYERLTLLLVPILTMIPGTHYWSRYFLRQPELRRKYLGEPEQGRYAAPLWSIEELQDDYISKSIDVKLSREEIDSHRDSLASLRPDVFSTWADHPERIVANDPVSTTRRNLLQMTSY